MNVRGVFFFKKKNYDLIIIMIKCSRKGAGGFSLR